VTIVAERLTVHRQVAALLTQIRKDASTSATHYRRSKTSVATTEYIERKYWLKAAVGTWRHYHYGIEWMDLYRSLITTVCRPNSLLSDVREASGDLALLVFVLWFEEGLGGELRTNATWLHLIELGRGEGEPNSLKKIQRELEFYADHYKWWGFADQIYLDY
jgi:hypothetical protein